MNCKFCNKELEIEIEYKGYCFLPCHCVGETARRTTSLRLLAYDLEQGLLSDLECLEEIPQFKGTRDKLDNLLQERK